MSNRLIILNTDGSTPDGLKGIFDAQFKEEIIIDENSEIALQSTLINRNINFLELGQSTNEIICRINTDGDSKVRFPIGTYTKTNLLSFMKQAQNSLNKELKVNMTHPVSGVVKAVGRKINFLIDGNEKVNITYTQEPLVKYTKKSDSITNDDWVINSNGSLNFKGGTGADHKGGYFTADNPEAVLQNYGVSEHFFSKGCGAMRARIAVHNNTDSSVPAGMLMGLVSSDLVTKVNDGTLVLDDISYGIRTNTNFLNEQVFQVKTPDSATWVDTEKTASNNTTDTLLNDILFIRLDQGKLKLGVVKHPAPGSGNPVLSISVSSTPYDYGTTDDEKSYMPIICVFGDETTSRLGRLGITFDSDSSQGLDRIKNYDSETTEYTATEFSDATLAVVGQTGKVSIPVRFEFPTIEMANFFGYKSQIQLSADSNLDFQYEANDKISILLSTSTYLIELLNLSVDSYHSGEKGRKNILSSVPVVENNLGLIQYEPANLIYIALNNKYKQTIRNIRARIITNEFNTLETQGTSEINLLIRKQK